MEKMINKNKISSDKVLIFVIILFFIIIAVYKFNIFFVERDYWILSEKSCDPEMEVCYVSNCEYLVDGTEVCGSEYEYFYNKIFIKADKVTECNQNYKECEDLSCEGLSPDECYVLTCTDENLGEGESCLKYSK